MSLLILKGANLAKTGKNKCDIMSKLDDRGAILTTIYVCQDGPHTEWAAQQWQARTFRAAKFKTNI